MAGRGGPGAPDEPASQDPTGQDAPAPDEQAPTAAAEPEATGAGERERSLPDPDEPEIEETIRPWWAVTAATPLPPAARAAVPALPSPSATDAAADVSGRVDTPTASVAGDPERSSAGHPGTAPRDSVMDEPDRDRTPLRLVWGAGSLLAVVILVSLFFLGQRIGGSPTALPTPTPTPTPAPTAAQPPGVHVWNTLFGGECLQPFTSPWDHEFTVVDCATPHAAQLAYRGTFDPTNAFPGESALADRINTLCTAPGIIDLAAARGYAHLVMQGSYPVTAEQWTDNPYYYCFVSSEAAQPITADIAGPGPTAAPAAPGTPAAPDTPATPTPATPTPAA